MPTGGKLQGRSVDHQPEQSFDLKQMSLSEYSRRVMRSQIQNRTKIQKSSPSSPKRKQTTFGTGISKNLYSLYLRKYAKKDQSENVDAHINILEKPNKKRTKMLSERGATVHSDQSPSDQIQKSTLAASSLNERLKNKKEGVLVSKDQFQLARREIEHQKLKDLQEIQTG